MQVSHVWLFSGRRSFKGWNSGISIDSQIMLANSLRTGDRPMNDFPLQRAAEAYDRMMCGKARFRFVLTIGD